MGLGRLLTNLQEDRQWPELWAGGHHMGMTRMHADPKQGVVDRNSKVHGMENLYVAGSSVFPTADIDSPTIGTAVQAQRNSHVWGLAHRVFYLYFFPAPDFPLRTL